MQMVSITWMRPFIVSLPRRMAFIYMLTATAVWEKLSIKRYWRSSERRNKIKQPFDTAAFLWERFGSLIQRLNPGGMIFEECHSFL